MTTSGGRRLIKGFGFSGFRSFFGDPARVGPLTEVTMLAGQNNSGKSNVLRFAQTILGGLGSTSPGAPPQAPALLDLDRPRGPLGDPLIVEFAIAEEQPAKPGDDLGRWLASLRKFIHRETQDFGVGWLPLVQEDSSGGSLIPSSTIVDLTLNKWADWAESNTRTALNVLGGGKVDDKDIVARLLLLLLPRPLCPPVVTIGAVRSAGKGGAASGLGELAGEGLIDRIAGWQSPELATYDKDTERFERVTRFVQRILGDASIRLVVPTSRSALFVKNDHRILPLENLGSGVEQVLVLAAAATSVDRHLVCLEEPETHLHPLLQKELLRFLTEETSNQYLIASHSPHVLARPEATVLHVRHSAIAGSTVRPASRPHEFVSICADLGHRASDILQANSVVWVEGPSDRIYLRHWLSLTAPALVEGLHYSVMFYGGRLLNHLTVDDEALQDFIDLRRLNQNSAVIIDSDLKTARGRISATKRRIVEEFDGEPDRPGMAWVTKCNTIENYVPRELLQRAVSATHPGRKLQDGDAQWSNPLAVKGDERGFDKIAIARSLEGLLGPDDLATWDLKKRISALAAFIASVNDLVADM